MRLRWAQDQVSAHSPCPCPALPAAVPRPPPALLTPAGGTGSRCKWGHCQLRVRAAADGPDRPSGAGEDGEALRGDWGQPWVQGGHGVQQQIFSNQQRFALMSMTSAPSWSGTTAHLLHHPTAANACHVRHVPPGSQLPS